MGIYGGYGDRDSFYCGGALIDPEWVLTAAHCVTDAFWGDPYSPEAISVTVGLRDRMVATIPDFQRIASVHVHPGWDSSRLTADVALLRLQDPGRNAGTPTLGLGRTAPAAGLSVRTIGWGLTETETYPDVLRQADLVVTSGPTQDRCRAIDGSTGPLGGYIPEWMLCAGGASEEMAVSGCFGDSGTALVTNVGGSWQAVGVTSWGYACGDYYLPGVYTRLTRALSWIDAQMRHPSLSACGWAPSVRFGDVDPTSYYAGAVDCLARIGVTQGWAGRWDIYNPTSATTRGQLATFLWRTAGAPGHPAAPLLCGYVDVDKTDFFARAACWMKGQGLTIGWGGDPLRFAPQERLTRGQLATFLWRYAGEPAAPSCEVSDVDPQASYAVAVCWLKEQGITQTGTRFSPGTTVSRGQLAAFLWRYGVARGWWFTAT